VSSSSSPTPPADAASGQPAAPVAPAPPAEAEAGPPLAAALGRPAFRIRLEYGLESGAQQSGADLSNPLFEMLRALREAGSILRAARQLGLSYRHVWGAIKRWEEGLGQALVVWSQGQRAQLTPFAERLLWGETRARARLAPHIEALRVELTRVVEEAVSGAHLQLLVHASHDLALPLLQSLAREQQALHVALHFCGSVDALQALAEGRCTVAGFHVPALPRGSAVFAQVMKPRLQPGAHKLLACVRRTQGLMVAHGNPLQLHEVADLVRPGVRFMDRQEGSGTRLLLEHWLDEAGLSSSQLQRLPGDGENSHVAVAAAVASGVADAGIGIEAAARSFGLGFVPLVEEDYFLVCLKEALDTEPVLRLREALQGQAWRGTVAEQPGYAIAPDAGEVLSLTKALPWWDFGPQRRSTISAQS
jgi:putative molybdopterin biosynthesis protein